MVCLGRLMAEITSITNLLIRAFKRCLKCLFLQMFACLCLAVAGSTFRPLRGGIYGIHLASLTTALGHATCFMPKGLNFLFHSYKCCYFCAIPARRWSTAATMMRSNAEHRAAKPKNHIDT